MRKILIGILINMIYCLNKKRSLTYYQDLPVIIANDRFLEIAMPNGDLIPGQIDLNIQQPLKMRGIAIAKITLFVKFDNLIK